MGGRNAVDGERFAGGFGEMEKAADVVVLVVTGEEAFGFRSCQVEGGECDGLAKIGGVGTVQVDKFAQGHHGSAGSGLGAYGVPHGECTAGTKRKEELNTEAQRTQRKKNAGWLAVGAGIG